MNLRIPVRILRELGKGEDAKYPEFMDMFSSWRRDSDIVTTETNILGREKVEAILKFMDEDPNPIEEYSPLKKRISSWNRLMKTGSTKVLKRLLDIPDSFKSFCEANMPSYLIYLQDEFGATNPYVAISCEYVERTKYNDAHVSFTFRATKQGSEVSKSFSIYTSDLTDRTDPDNPEVGKTIMEILSDNNCMVENDELNMDHLVSLDKYKDLMKATGRVYVGSGRGKSYSERIDRWGDRRSDMVNFYFKENISPKVVIDFSGIYDDSSGEDKRVDDKIVYSSVIGEKVKLPIHTYGDVFHLEDHVYISIHVDYLEEYEFKGLQLMDKLVLPETDKQLIKILMEMSKMKIEDIVEGKSGGSFVMATGVPGTGKTLTAEVFSETIEKPLYKVQCSQLGLDVDTVEKNLKKVLSRAGRWGAILLIDEADVYVRARGTDINQNAIVGTFLRTLEYYTGILFMTSNMETAIDDAIMSRATAHLQYGSPSPADQTKIWSILATQFEIPFSSKDIDELVSHFPQIVGRDIKALLKLGKMYAEGKDIKCTPKVIKSISGFVPNVNKEK